VGDGARVAVICPVGVEALLVITVGEVGEIGTGVGVGVGAGVKAGEGVARAVGVAWVDWEAGRLQASARAHSNPSAINPLRRFIGGKDNPGECRCQSWGGSPNWARSAAVSSRQAQHSLA
jgi:hypothetical protein